MTYFRASRCPLTIFDNLRAGVTHPDRCEAELNVFYRELATHYGTLRDTYGGQDAALQAPLVLSEPVG